jgi:DNA-binding YbaB/EbfC family protein
MSGPGTPDIGQILQQAQQVQGKLAALQRELATRRFEGSAGGGMVTVVAAGDLRILEVRIEPGLFAEGDRGMIQDLCAAATNVALTNAQQGVRDEMQRVTGGMGLPDLSSLGLQPPDGSGR